MTVTVIPVVVSALGTISKELKKGHEGLKIREQVLYSIKHDLRNSMNELQWTNEKHFFMKKNISLILFSKGAHSLLWVWEINGEAYTQRGNFSLLHIFFLEPGGANACTPLQAVSSEKT